MYIIKNRNADNIATKLPQRSMDHKMYFMLNRAIIDTDKKIKPKTISLAITNIDHFKKIFLMNCFK